MLRFILIFGLIIGAIIAIEHYIFSDLREVFMAWLHELPHLGVWIVYALSETLLGMIPPDFFIIWSTKFGKPLLYLSLLGVISYLAGFISYYIGYQLGKRPKVERWLKNRYSQFVKRLRQWGGLLIIVAALLPLPYSTVCLISGLVKYPFSKLWLYGLSRILRFFLYASFLFKVF